MLRDRAVKGRVLSAGAQHKPQMGFVPPGLILSLAKAICTDHCHNDHYPSRTPYDPHFVFYFLIPFTPPTSVWSLSWGFDPSSPGVRKELFLCGPALQTWTSDSGWSLEILLCLGKQELVSSWEELSVALKCEQCFWTHKQGAL